MSLNCAEIDKILSELNLSGSFIQNIVQPSYDTIALYTYKEGQARTVLICLAPGVCRLHETRRAVPKNDKPLRFMEFMRSRIKGSRIMEAVQLDNNRIVRFSLVHGDERFFAYVRLWSGAANIVITDPDHRILDVFYRRPKRNEISGGQWETPPARPGDSQTVWTVRSFDGVDDAQGGDTKSESFNILIDRWYAEHAAALSRQALVEEAKRRFETRRFKLESALVKLEKKRADFLNADRYRHQGDLLTANLWAVKAGMKNVELEDYENANAPILIPLDERLSPQENARSYYDKYKKAVSGLADLDDDIAQAKRTLDRLALELEAIEAEKNPLVIHAMLRRQNKPKQQVKKKYPGLVFRKDGWIILVGRTSAENDELLRRHVKGSDMWLHTRDWPGGYVFIKNRPGKSIPLELLLDAGTLALFYSKGRKAHTGDLYYTQVKHLRRAKNAPKGTVLPSNEKNLTVSLDDARLKKLEQCKDDE